jgi:hypothetical protein
VTLGAEICAAAVLEKEHQSFFFLSHSVSTMMYLALHITSDVCGQVRTRRSSRRHHDKEFAAKLAPVTTVQIFRVSKREACSGGVVKRVPRSGVYEAESVVRLAFTYLGQVMARRRLFVYTKLDASHLEMRRWFFEALATSATGWPCSVSGGPLKEGSARWWWGSAGRVPVMKALCTVVAVLEQRLSSAMERWAAAPGLADWPALTSVVVASASEGAWSRGRRLSELVWPC